MKTVVKIFVQSKLIFVLLVFFSYIFRIVPTHVEYTGEKGWLNPFTAYDSLNYLTIAENGYVAEHLYAFFPFYPVMIKATTFLGISPALGGFSISVLASFLSAYLFYKIAGEPYKKIVTWLWCMSPIAIFSWSVYTESLFVFLSLFAYYLFTKKKLVWVGVLVGLAMLTRNTGYFLIPFFMILLYQEKKQIGDYVRVTIPASLIGSIYPLYLWWTKGSPLYFAKVQVLFNKVAGFPWETIWRDFKIVSVQGDYSLIILINWVAFSLAIYLAIKYRKEEWGYSILLLFGAIYPLFAPTIPKNMSLEESIAATISLVRYIFGLFPVYFLLAKEWEGKKKRLLFFGMGIFIYIFLTYMFISKSFIA